MMGTQEVHREFWRGKYVGMLRFSRPGRISEVNLTESGSSLVVGFVTSCVDPWGSAA